MWVFFPLILKLCSSSRQVVLSGATLTDVNKVWKLIKVMGRLGKAPSLQ